MKVVSIHKSGIMYCVAAIVVSLVAIYGGNNLHYLAASAILGYFAASGVAGYRNIRSAEVTLSYPDEIYARSPFMLKVNVRCGTRAPIFLVTVKYGPSSAFFPIVHPGETASRPIVAELPRRGRYAAGDAELSSSYPFGFFTRYLPVRGPESVTVFPVPLQASGTEVGAWMGDEDEAEHMLKPHSDHDTIGVRPYIEGDSMRVIHWKSSAKTGRMSSRLYDDGDDGSARVIDLDALLERGKEAGLSAASHEISLAIKSGRPIGMSGGGRLWPASESRADKLSMLSALAVYE